MFQLLWWTIWGEPGGEAPDPLDPMGAGPLDILRVRRHRMMGKGGK